MFVEVFRQEDGIDIGHGLGTTVAGLVVDHADIFVVNQIQSVDAAPDDAGLEMRRMRCELTLHVVFQSENGEGCQSEVDGDELTEVVDDDLAVDELQASFRSIGDDAVEGLVDGTLDFLLRLQQVFEQGLVDLSWQLPVDDVGSFVEDIAEDAVVEVLLIVGHFGLMDVGDVEIVEL